jgi:site-specific DNA recombinase
MLDRRKAPIIKSAFELYAEGKSRLTDVSFFIYDKGIKTQRRKGGEGGRKISDDHVKRILTDPFYYGHFSYGGDIWKGNHTPIISKALFDKVQEVLEIRGRGQKAKKDPQALCGLLHCGNCGCFITAEVLTKYQKNRNIHRYVYYHCTRKRGRCSEPYIREEALADQLSNILSYYTLPPEWARELNLMADKDEKEAQSVAALSVQELRAKVADIDGGVSRLTDLYIEQDIDRDAYLLRKRALMSDRKTTEEQVARLERNAAGWLQPMREWINDASMLEEIQKNDDLPSKKISLQKIFGSNLTLQSREARGIPKNQWLSLAQAKENSEKSSLSTLLVRARGIEPRTYSV